MRNFEETITKNGKEFTLYIDKHNNCIMIYEDYWTICYPKQFNGEWCFYIDNKDFVESVFNLKLYRINFIHESAEKFYNIINNQSVAV